MVYEALLKYIASLSDEEKKQYANLIEEALRRDREMAETFRTARENTERFAGSMERIMQEVLKLQAGISSINEGLSELKERSRIISRTGKDDGPCMN